jgi:hypothetical protein
VQPQSGANVTILTFSLEKELIPLLRERSDDEGVSASEQFFKKVSKSIPYHSVVERQ